MNDRMTKQIVDICQTGRQREKRKKSKKRNKKGQCVFKREPNPLVGGVCVQKKK